MRTHKPTQAGASAVNMYMWACRRLVRKQRGACPQLVLQYANKDAAAPRVQVAVPLLMFHLMKGKKPLPGQCNAGVGIVCHDDFVMRRMHAGSNDERLPAHPEPIPAPTRCLSRSCSSPMHLHASNQSSNARSGRTRRQQQGRKRRLAFQEQP
jgi:hypothetical protein